MEDSITSNKLVQKSNTDSSPVCHTHASHPAESKGKKSISGESTQLLSKSLVKSSRFPKGISDEMDYFMYMILV